MAKLDKWDKIFFLIALAALSIIAIWGCGPMHDSNVRFHERHIHHKRVPGGGPCTMNRHIVV